MWGHFFPQLCHFAPTSPTAFTGRVCFVVVWYRQMSISNTATYLGLYALSWRTSYRKISRSIEGARFGSSNRSVICQALWQQRCRDVCQISKRYDQYNIHIYVYDNLICWPFTNDWWLDNTKGWDPLINTSILSHACWDGFVFNHSLPRPQPNPTPPLPLPSFSFYLYIYI